MFLNVDMLRSSVTYSGRENSVFLLKERYNRSDMKDGRVPGRTVLVYRCQMQSTELEPLGDVMRFGLEWKIGDGRRTDEAGANEKSQKRRERNGEQMKEKSSGTKDGWIGAVH